MKKIIPFQLFEDSQEEIKKQFQISQDEIRKSQEKIKTIKSSLGDLSAEDPAYLEFEKKISSLFKGKTVTFYGSKKYMETKSNPNIFKIKYIMFRADGPNSSNGNYIELFGDSTTGMWASPEMGSIKIYSPKAALRNKEIASRSNPDWKEFNVETQLGYIGPPIKISDNPEENKLIPNMIVWNPNLYNSLQKDSSIKDWITYRSPVKKFDSTDF
jgi:hypothetical protein